MRVLRAVALLLLLASVAAAGGVRAAEEAPVSLTLRPVVRPRTGAPIWVDAEFDVRATGLVEGCLEIVFSDGMETVARYRSADLALTAGKQTFRLMLPPVAVSMGRAQSMVSPVFRTREGTYRFAPQPLDLPAQGAREFVVCVAASDIEWRLAAGDVTSSLRLEGYDPESAAVGTRSYTTRVDTMAPREFPASPLPYCCFDIVVLPAEGFGQLQSRQLDALRRWVEGGGSLCVLPRGGLKGHHEKFLNDLVGRGDRPFRLGPAGELDAGGAFEGIAMLRPGLGRAVVVLPEAQGGLDAASPAWRRAVAFLWKLRAGQTEPFVNGGRWQMEKPDESSQRWDRYGRLRNQGQSFAHLPLEDTEPLQECLMPTGVRMVPSGVLLLVFVAFVAAIGPLDYWLLGRLRKRACTWLLFPVLSVGFAGLVVYLSEHYMGSQDHTAAFVFVDVDRSGRALRWSRCEMVYAGRAHTVETRVQSALCAPLDEVAASYGYGWGYGETKRTTPSYTGRLPTDFVLTRRIGQWQPMFRRDISFESPKMPSRLNWQALEEADVNTYRGRAEAAGKLCAGTPFDGCVFYVHGDTISRIRGDERGLHRENPYEPTGDLKAFLRRVSARPKEGLFALVSQVSPGGPATLEDLSVLDSTDPGQRLLIAVERVGADYYVYRCLFCGGP